MASKKSSSKKTINTTAIEAEAEVKSDLNEISLLRKEIDRLGRELIKSKSGEQIIIRAVKDSLVEPHNLYIPPAPPKSKKKNVEIACLHISDTQIGKVTNTYNSQVAEDRLYLLARKVLKIVEMRRTNAAIDEIRVYLGGDIVEGENIFSTQPYQIDQSVFDQAIKTAPRILTNVILTLLQNFSKVKVYGVPGNHGRNGQKNGTIAHPRTNWDNVVYSTINSLLLENSSSSKLLKGRLEIIEPNNFYQVDRVFNWGNLIVHGHQVSGGFAGFPWYGVAKKVMGWIDTIPEPWDYLWLGHFHTYAGPVTINYRIFLSNGTTESDNEFAQEVLAAAGHPCQRLSFFNEEHGLISDNQIFLDDRKSQLAKYRSW